MKRIFFRSLTLDSRCVGGWSTIQKKRRVSGNAKQFPTFARKIVIGRGKRGSKIAKAGGGKETCVPRGRGWFSVGTTSAFAFSSPVCFATRETPRALRFQREGRCFVVVCFTRHVSHFRFVSRDLGRVSPHGGGSRFKRDEKYPVFAPKRAVNIRTDQRWINARNALCETVVLLFKIISLETHEYFMQLRFFSFWKMRFLNAIGYFSVIVVLKELSRLTMCALLIFSVMTMMNHCAHITLRMRQFWDKILLAYIL